ncbi:MAG: hypothetical protein ACR2RE_05010 [Geminicoccaceae bacterium]
MTDVDASLTPLRSLIGIGLLIICATLRLMILEVQIRTLGGPKNERSVDLIAGYMLRGRSCRGALVALYGAAMAFVLSDAFNGLFVAIGFSDEGMMRFTGMLGAALLVLALALLLIDSFMSIESLEQAARTKLDNRERR